MKAGKGIDEEVLVLVCAEVANVTECKVFMLVRGGGIRSSEGGINRVRENVYGTACFAG